MTEAEIRNPLINGIVHILVNPPENLEINLVKEAAAVLRKDLYETRLLLSGKIPKLIAHYQNYEEAEQVTGRLKTLGLTALVLSDRELDDSPEAIFDAHAIVFGEKEVSFRDKGGRLLKLESQDVFLLLKGRRQLANDKTVNPTRMKFNLPATLLTGGIPVMRKVTEKTKTNSNETEYFVRIYSLISPEPVVQFFENHFDFSSLGVKIALSTTTNLNGIIAELKAIFPLAIYDDRLAQSSGMSASSDKPTQTSDLNCKFIYLCYKTIHSSD